MTDFDKEVARLEAESEALAVLDTEQLTRQLYRRFQHASLMGSISCFVPLDKAIDVAMNTRGPAPDLWLLKAYIALALHRFTDALAYLSADPAAEESLQGHLLKSDLHLEHGRYDQARSNVEQALARAPTWDAFARAANLAAIMGDIEAAERLYQAAEDELTAKQMRSFAWVLVQRGTLQLQRGYHAMAQTYYQRAADAYSGYWLVEERTAELLGAEGKFEQAIAGYKRLYARLQKPEWEHAIGDLYSLSHQPGLAEQWKRKALCNYQRSADRGEAVYYHYLTDLCCELGGHVQDAVTWARKDVALRANYATMGDLAWALYRNRSVSESLTWVERALASGAVSARLYFQAATIYAAAGMRERARHYIRLCLQTNPRPPRARIRGLSAVTCT